MLHHYITSIVKSKGYINKINLSPNTFIDKLSQPIGKYIIILYYNYERPSIAASNERPSNAATKEQYDLELWMREARQSKQMKQDQN